MIDIPKFHLLLSDVHKLLSSYSSQEFADAAEASQDCRVALQALSRLSQERNTDRPSQVDSSSLILDEELVMPSTEAGRPSLSISPREYPKSIEEIADMLRRSGRAETTSGLESIVAEFGLGLSITSKPGRVRNLLKVAKAIAASPQRLRSQIIKSILKDSKSDTQGWLDVIRSGR